MTDRADFLKALSEAPGTPVTADTAIPGLPTGEWCLPALWSIQARTRAMLGDGIEESLREGREFTAGPWDD